MTEELEQLLRNLHLKRILEIYDDHLQTSEKNDATYTDFFLGLMRPQWHARQEQSLEWRIKRAGLPEQWTLETFPYAKQPGVNRRQIRGFAELDFIAKAENIVFIGKTGVGKTGLAIGILLKALQNGYRGQFVRAQDLFDEMYASLADRSSRKLVDRLARLDVLCIDEMGYVNCRPEQANIFFKLMEERYNKKATVITTNLEYEEWANFLGNKLMVDALLGRLRHRCHTVTIKGPTLRAPKIQELPWAAPPSAAFLAVQQTLSPTTHRPRPTTHGRRANRPPRHRHPRRDTAPLRKHAANPRQVGLRPS